jgi:catechol 2,3-dioxygenase-like lactoylglutathione lyase family enzyme
MENESSLVSYCMPVIPSLDLEKSLRFWVEGLGFIADRHMYEAGRLVGCMVQNNEMYFWLNQRLGDRIPEDLEGIRLYWTPNDINTARERLQNLGYKVSAMEDREYGNTEFVLTDDDGYSHCFGVAIKP